MNSNDRAPSAPPALRQSRGGQVQTDAVKAMAVASERHPLIKSILDSQRQVETIVKRMAMEAAPPAWMKGILEGHRQMDGIAKAMAVSAGPPAWMKGILEGQRQMDAIANAMAVSAGPPPWMKAILEGQLQVNGFGKAIAAAAEPPLFLRLAMEGQRQLATFGRGFQETIAALKLNERPFAQLNARLAIPSEMTNSVAALMPILTDSRAWQGIGGAFENLEDETLRHEIRNVVEAEALSWEIPAPSDFADDIAQGLNDATTNASAVESAARDEPRRLITDTTAIVLKAAARRSAITSSNSLGVLGVILTILAILIAHHDAGDAEGLRRQLGAIARTMQIQVDLLTRLTPSTLGWSVYVVERPTNLRSRPNARRPPIGSLAVGQRFFVLAEHGRWVYVASADVEVPTSGGWVLRKYLRRVR